MIDRRAILSVTAGGSAASLTAGAQDVARRHRIWDIHCHLGSVPGSTPEERMEVLVRSADPVAIEKLILSQGFSSVPHPTPVRLREEKDRVKGGVKRLPD